MSDARPRVDVYYALVSPWTYLAWPRLEALAANGAARIELHPIDLGTVFPRTGGLPLAKRPPERRAYRLMELRRWRSRLGLPLTLEPAFFPVDGRPASLCALALLESGGPALAFSSRVLRAAWAEERNIADPGTVEALLRETGLDPKPVLATAARPETAARFERESEQAIERGVFGAPSFHVGDELFWGQDRLDFVAEALGLSPDAAFRPAA